MSTLDAVANFAYGVVTVAPSPADSGTSLSMATADADLFPDPSTQAYNMIVFPSNAAPSDSNAEIVRATAKGSPSGGNVAFTIAREQESTSARTIVVGDRVVLTPTAKMILDIQTVLDTLLATSSGWNAYSTVIPTRASADDPTYILTFAGVDLTSSIQAGDRVKFTQNAATVYGIVTAIAFSTNTTLTIYGGTDYDVLDTATYAISNFYYSHQKSPIGFPTSPAKWTVTLTNTSQLSQGSVVSGTWYNIGSLTITAPIGLWNISIFIWARYSLGSNVYSGLSTANNTSPAGDLKLLSVGDTSFGQASNYRESLISLASKQQYYLNLMTDASGGGTLYADGAGSTTTISIVSAYL